MNLPSSEKTVRGIQKSGSDQAKEFWLNSTVSGMSTGYIVLDSALRENRFRLWKEEK